MFCKSCIVVQLVFVSLQGELIGICGMKGSGKSAFLCAVMGRVSVYNLCLRMLFHKSPPAPTPQLKVGKTEKKKKRKRRKPVTESAV